MVGLYESFINMYETWLPPREKIISVTEAVLLAVNNDIFH
jgi:hypothetical protein